VVAVALVLLVLMQHQQMVVMVALVRHLLFQAVL
jgi:hypothetical protein